MPFVAMHRQADVSPGRTPRGCPRVPERQLLGCLADHIEGSVLPAEVLEQNDMLAKKSDATATLNAIELANEYARPVLKTEWQRVKEGELAFRIARNWVAPAIVLVSLAFITFVVSGTFVA